MAANHGWSRNHRIDMSRYNWDMSSGLYHVPAQGSYDPNTAQIACRICGQVFMNTQGLINHIETHMGNDEAFSRRRYENVGMLSNPRDVTFHQNSSAYYHLPRSMPQGGFSQYPAAGYESNHPLFGGSYQIGTPLSTELFLPARTNNNYLVKPKCMPAPQVTPWLALEEPSSDGTKPFLRQLEQRLFFEMKCQHQEKGKNGAGSTSGMLDLTLKL